MEDYQLKQAIKRAAHGPTRTKYQRPPPTDYQLRLQMVRNARARAKRAGLPCTITADDIRIPSLCPVFGRPMLPATGHRGGTPWSPSLDRIIPAKGYVRGNIQVISRRANGMKQDVSIRELRLLALHLLKHQERPDGKAKRLR